MARYAFRLILRNKKEKGRNEEKKIYNESFDSLLKGGERERERERERNPPRGLRREIILGDKRKNGGEGEGEGDGVG